MNRSEIRTQARMFLNEPTAGFWSDANLNSYIDLSVSHLSSIISSVKEDYFTVSSTFSTVASTKSYSFPTDCRAIRRMEVYNTSDPNEIKKLDQMKFPRTEAQGEWPYGQNNEPEGYVVRGTQFDLYPIPDAVYSIRIYYDRKQVALATDSDSPAAESDFHDMIVYWTCVLALLQQATDPTIYANLFNARKTELITTLVSRGSNDPQTTEGYLEGFY